MTFFVALFPIRTRGPLLALMNKIIFNLKERVPCGEKGGTYPLSEDDIREGEAEPNFGRGQRHMGERGER